LLPQPSCCQLQFQLPLPLPPISGRYFQRQPNTDDSTRPRQKVPESISIFIPGDPFPSAKQTQTPEPKRRLVWLVPFDHPQVPDLGPSFVRSSSSSSSNLARSNCRASIPSPSHPSLRSKRCSLTGQRLGELNCAIDGFVSAGASASRASSTPAL
jgi:hypothetical protein